MKGGYSHLSVIEFFKDAFITSMKIRWLNKIDKEYDRYVKLKNKAKVQQQCVNHLIDTFNAAYDENLRGIK